MKPHNVWTDKAGIGVSWLLRSINLQLGDLARLRTDIFMNFELHMKERMWACQLDTSNAISFKLAFKNHYNMTWKLFIVTQIGYLQFRCCKKSQRVPIESLQSKYYRCIYLLVLRERWWNVFTICSVHVYTLEGLFHFIFTEAVLQLTQNFMRACQLLIKLQKCVQSLRNVIISLN